MGRAKKAGVVHGRQWLLFFYTVPSKPVNSRMRVWRRLLHSGAVQLKGSVYILPYSEEHREFFHWLLAEVYSMKGDGMIVTIDGIDTMKDPEILSLFEKQRESDYRPVGNRLDDLEKQLNSIAKGSKSRGIELLKEQLVKAVKDYEVVRKRDFFSSAAGDRLLSRIKHLNDLIAGLQGKGMQKGKSVEIVRRSPDRYQGRKWVTRKRPFIDRMASAWLIRRFIDRKASFDFMDEKDLASAGPTSIVFDVRGGEFTHAGDLCTFEVLMRSFGLKDRGLRKIAEIVHDLDVKDEKYRAIAGGIEGVLEGIRKTAKNDHDALDKGMAVFEMLYASIT